MKLLVVDDHRECRGMAARLLTCLGHEVSEAAAPAEAEALVRVGKPDLVMIDLFLDGSDGVALASRLEAELAGLRVLFMSGHGAGTAEVPDLAGPRRHFIEKPFSLPALEAALDALLRRP